MVRLFLIITKLNLGNLDYPVLILSEHTVGMLGSALPVLIFGLIGNKYFRLCKVISSFKKKILNLLCHVGGGNVE